MGSHLHRQDYRRPHAWRPCVTGSRGPRFVCRDLLQAVAVPLCNTPRARYGGTSGGPARHPSYLGAEGHGFFSRRFSLAMRRACGLPDTTPCSSLGLGPMCMTVVPQQPDSIVTVLVSEAVWERYDRIFRFRSNPFPAAREPPCLGPQPIGPVVHHSPRVCHSTWRQTVRAPRRCGSRGSSPVCGSHFPCMRKARDWSRSASFVPRVTAHHVRVR